MTATLNIATDTKTAEIQRIFKLQKENQYKVANTTAKQRIAKLDKLHKAVLKYRPAIKEALYQDFRKQPTAMVGLKSMFATLYREYAHLKHSKTVR